MALSLTPSSCQKIRGDQGKRIRQLVVGASSITCSSYPSPDERSPWENRLFKKLVVEAKLCLNVEKEILPAFV